MTKADWSARSRRLDGGRGIEVELELEARPASYAQVLQAWRDDPEFRGFFSQLLAEAPFRAFRWETPAVTGATADRPFEFVLIDSPWLDGRPDPADFAGHFAGAGDRTVLAFSNLGGDAVMVVPCPLGPRSAYGHLAAFVRQAPAAQVQALWRCVGVAMARRLGVAPVWLSTAGGGVPWLHVRLDDRPKYYAHAPYRQPWRLAQNR